MIRRIAGLMILLIMLSCQQKQKSSDTMASADATHLHTAVNRLNDVVIYEIFSPPVASRIYAYTTLAAFEASRWMDTSYHSLTAQLNGFPAMPEPEKGKQYDFRIAGIEAFFNISLKLTFTKDSSKITQEKILKEMKEGVDDEVYASSIAFGDSVAEAVWKRATTDQYKEIQGMARYTPQDIPGHWKNTPPDYLDAVQPFWSKMKPLVMDSSSQFKPVPPPAYSTDTSSGFWKELMEVYHVSKSLTEEQKNMARFWDDNAAAITYKGHMMFANKKPSPGGHWMNITSIACKKTGFNWLQSSETYAITAVAMYEAFLSCWDEKYRSEYIRPVTAINETFDKNWQPFLQTPPFPEYTSGHSVASATISTVLTRVFGDNFEFTDNYELPYIGIERSFPSFIKASEEACMSRLYGGIHFNSAIINGRTQGRNLGAYINNNIRRREE